MKTSNRLGRLTLLPLLALLLSASGCATISTLGQPAHEGHPLIMSGVRLDLAALKDEAAVTERFGVSPPDYPLLDLPFSVMLDTLMLGYTLPVAWFHGR